MTLIWPIHVLRPAAVSFDIASRSLAAPAAVNGFRQVVASDAGIWTASFVGVSVRSRDTVLAFRAIATLLEGQLNPILVPRCRGYQPVPDGLSTSSPGVPHSDGAFFSDGTGYESSLNSVTASAAALGAVSMTMNVAVGGTIEPGHDFSIGEQMYRVRTAVYADENTVSVTFRPPLREAVAEGAVVEFDNPVCRMRLASDSEMNLELSQFKFGRPTVNFIEDV